MSVPWQLLLPGDSQSQVLWLGGRADFLREILTVRPVLEAVRPGAIAAVVRGPGGPESIESLPPKYLDAIGPETSVVWVRRRRSVLRDQNDPFESGRYQVFRFSANGRAVWDDGAGWATPLPGAGKKEYIKSLLPTWISILAALSRGAGKFEVLIGCPTQGHAEIWALEFTDALRRSQLIDHGPLSLGRIDATHNRAALLQFASSDGNRYFAKVALHPDVGSSMARESSIVNSVRHRLTGHESLLQSIPVCLYEGQSHGHYFRLGCWMVGRPAIEFMYQTSKREELIDKAIDWLQRYHGATTGEALDPRSIADYSRNVLGRFESSGGGADRRFIERIAGYLARQFRDSVCSSVLGHGDFWLGNILCCPIDLSVRGVIDWDFGDQLAPPLEDLLHLLCHRKSLLSVYDPGNHLARLFAGRYPEADQKRISAYVRSQGVDVGLTGALVLLYWVRYLGSRVATLSSRRRWESRSYWRVKKVLQTLGDEDLDEFGTQLAGSTDR
jgi:hypothetical protein